MPSALWDHYLQSMICDWQMHTYPKVTTGHSFNYWVFMKIALLFGRATKCYIAVSAHSTQSSKCLTIRWSVHAENSYVIKNYNATSFWLTVDTTERTLLCCSSYPNRTRYARLRFGLGCKLDRKSILTAYCRTRKQYRCHRLKALCINCLRVFCPLKFEECANR